jgi:hypothetical protein
MLAVRQKPLPSPQCVWPGTGMNDTPRVAVFQVRGFEAEQEEKEGQGRPFQGRPAEGSQGGAKALGQQGACGKLEHK